MLYLVTGGSGSGKSEYAEKLAAEKHNAHPAGRLLYVATMYPYDEECHVRIQRHREQRWDKGFETVECYAAVEQLIAEKEDVLLLECMSNLLANEMYRPEGRVKARGEEADGELEYAVIRPVSELAGRVGELIVVTNEVFSDGVRYDEESMEYMRLLGKVNRELGREAAQVTEVVCGIPIEIRK